MKLHKVLCPIDFSPTSDNALRLAAALARESQAELAIVYVDEGPLAYDAGIAGFVESQEDQISTSQRLKAAGNSVHGVNWHDHQLQGDPADEIVRLAEEEGVDLIVMATHGHTGLMRVLMGSVAESVVRRAPCPVLTLKQPAVIADDSE